ncbi:winged helix-turn-helix domain-containing protein [Streptomyces sp. NPDC052023]|uniref:winged helix-turn-helix domain-containing protein n=1 Tax=Streptomyces sp. NPDC052023 TaxID=3365681 RepID=UPI0037D3C229
MANPGSLSRSASRPLSPAPAPGGSRHRLRAVDPEEVRGVPSLLPPGATWLPAPQEALPSLPGRPPMVGYLVLVPADQQPPFLPVAATGAPATADDLAATGTGPTGTDATADPLIRVDPQRRTAEVAGRELDLTYLEFELLAHLVAHPHRVHTRDQLVTTVWGYGHVGDGRTVDVHIARLRRKLGAEHRQAILTVRRVGYKYAPPAGD